MLSKLFGNRSGKSAMAIALVQVMALSILFAPTAQAQEYPNKPIKIVVPFPPGGSTDIWARVFADKLRAKWGQPVLIENRAGAGGNVGAEMVARSAPDGYTLLVTAPGPLVINRALFGKLNFDPEAFVPVSIMAGNSSVLAVHPKMPVQNMTELIAYARANPGKLNYASAGSGTIQHLAGEMLASKAGLKMTHVPYKGNGPALADLLGGQVEMMFVELSTALPHIRSGKLRALAVGTEKRTPFLPNVPTASETVPGVITVAWIGMVAPPGTPAPIATKLADALNEALRQPDVIQKLTQLNVDAIGNSPAEMAKILKEDTERWGAIIRATGATAN